MKEKVVLITGGSKGIGRRTVEEFSAQGYTVVLNYRQNDAFVQELITELTKTYDNQIIPIKGDIAIPDECERMVTEMWREVDCVDILIHNAGPYVKERKSFTEYTPEEWNYIVNGNLNGVFYLSKLIIPKMREKKWGRIITFGYDRVESAPGWIYRSAFAAAKAGLASFTKTIAMEEAQSGITANMVCPGDIVGDWKESDIDQAIGQDDPSTPVGRPGTGGDLSRVISFLCKEESDFITGAIIPVTGGKDVLGKVFHQ
ncbi:SDR family oxidoreductase [Bacillus sp. KH172YL63]|uniref:SDR family oxidoreductase n=1 Tax=Bacillus sp. KH172YL63 TaxID=2709784 RepID=UPI0013E4F38D|nr:SDR family oxidoreductase [Bacillus sp. KH172YL63]BCB04388.1 3-ketoacyl-ACP reductase [Bacillus sp. KH172YL63]